MTAVPQRFTPRVQPVRAMQYAGNNARDVFDWVNRSRDYKAEWSERVYDYLAVFGPDHRGVLVAVGDWVVVDYDGALTVLPDSEFRDRYEASMVEPETEEVPPW